MMGHVMRYLGNDEGRAGAISAMSEYGRPCGDGEQTGRVDRVTVSDLELGRGTSRRSFLERLVRLAVFGPPSPGALP